MNVSEKFLRGLREPRLTWAAPGGNARHRLIGGAGGGKFCRGRHVLPWFRRGVARKFPVYRRFLMARHLLD
jgi:hypothetical protein